MRFLSLAVIFLAGSAHAQPAEFDAADFGKIVINARQSSDGLTFEQAFGDYQNEPVVDYGLEGPAVRLGRPIGRLDLLYKTGKPGFCTAFIVDDQHIVTNHHCIPGMQGDPTGAESGVTAVQFVAGYITPGRAVGVDKYTVSPQIVETNRALDYTVLKVFGDPASKYGTMQLTDGDPEDAEFLWIIGHPEGQSQHISREGCAAASPAMSSEGKLVHTCDTLSGNSGSPVIRIADRRVVGLHHAGNSRTGFNQAIPMRRILQESKILKAAVALLRDAAPALPKPDPVALACTALWTEATGLGCLGYKTYVSECGTHTFAGLAKGYIAENCVVSPVVQAPPATSGAVLTVKASGGGDYRDLAQAVAAAKPGTRIDVYPGTYTKGLRVDKPLDIVGFGDRKDIILRTRDETAITWTASSGLISNLTIRMDSGKKFAIKYQGGNGTLQLSDISSGGLAIVAITDGGDPLITENLIHDGAQSGIFVFDGGKGRVMKNVIEGNTYAGVAYKEGTDPSIINNDIRNNAQAGIYGQQDSKGLIQGNRIYGNGKAGIELKLGTDAYVTKNEIRDNAESGIFLHKQAKGLIANNVIERNGFAGISVREGADPLIHNNEIRNNTQSGIYIQKNAKSGLGGNKIYGNGYSGIEVKLGGYPVARNNEIRDNKGSGVYVHDDGLGIFENNRITGNGKFGVSVKIGANPSFRDNDITGNAFHAIWVRDGGRGLYESNDLRNNGRGGFRIDDGAGKITRLDNRE